MHLYILCIIAKFIFKTLLHVTVYFVCTPTYYIFQKNLSGTFTKVINVMNLIVFVPDHTLCQIVFHNICIHSKHLIVSVCSGESNQLLRQIHL